MHPLQVVAECMVVPEDLGFAPRLVFSSQAERNSTTSCLVSSLMNCIFGVAIPHLAPLSMDEDLGMCVLLCVGSGHGRLHLGLWAFQALFGGGILAFEQGVGGLNTLFKLRKCTFNLSGGKGGAPKGKKAKPSKSSAGG